MSDQRKHYRLGIFVVLAFLVFIGLLVMLGAGKWMRTQVQLETYFDESVQGIDVGSAIRYRGVVVGQVSELGFSYTRYQQDLPPSQRKQYVMVTAKVQPTLFGGNKLSLPEQSDLNREIAKGLRIRIAPQGLTGTNYLEIDFADPASTPTLAVDWKPSHLYIPSASSTVKQFVDGAQEMMARLQRVDFDKTINNFNLLMETTEKKIAALPIDKLNKVLEQLSNELEQAQISKLSHEANALLKEARNTNRDLQALVNNPDLQGLPSDLAASAKQARAILENPEIPQAIHHLQQTLLKLDQITGSRDQEISSLIDNMHDISINLKTLSESLKNNPSGLLLSTPVKPYEPPK